MISFYWIRTLRNFQKTSSNLKEVSEELKEKLTSFSGIVAGITVLIKNNGNKIKKKEKRVKIFKLNLRTIIIGL